jgi:hypothetical protein
MPKTIEELKAEIKTEILAETKKIIAELSASVERLYDIHRIGGEGLRKDGTHGHSIGK